LKVDSARRRHMSLLVNTPDAKSKTKLFFEAANKKDDPHGIEKTLNDREKAIRKLEAENKSGSKAGSPSLSQKKIRRAATSVKAKSTALMAIPLEKP